MRSVAVDHSHVRQVFHLPVHSHLGISSAAQLLEQLFVMAFAAPYEGGKKIAFLPVIVFHDKGHYLLVSIPDHFLACGRGVCAGCLRIQQPEEIIYFGDGPDRGARVVAGGLLFYGNYRTQPGDALYFRLFQYAHELLGVGRQRIHVASLPFGIYRVERKGGLAASAQSCDHDKFVPRYRKRHILEIVRPGPAYFDVFRFFSHISSL